MTRKTFALLIVAATVALATACREDSQDTPTGAPPPGRESSPSPTASPENDATGRVSVRLRTAVDGLESPLYVTHAGDASGRLFVVEQVGRIRIVRDGRLVGEPFLDVSRSVIAGGEQGLLGLAFHPDYEDNGRFFVNYTDTQGDTVVAEYHSEPAAGAADPGSRRVLLTIDQPFSNHNGGAIEFGPDGYLYIGTGDGGSGGDPFGNGQSLTTLLGKLLRIDVDGPEPYGVPRDNPFARAGDARREIWAYGLRNPWRFSFDRARLWIADVGQGAFEEINRMPACRAGVNYGWNVMEGPECYESTRCDRQGLALPISWYTHDEGCSVTGGYVYRGESFPDLQGTYLFGDYCSGTVWGLDADGAGRQRPVKLLDTDRSISSFGVDERGELYLTDIASGEVLQVTAGA